MSIHISSRIELINQFEAAPTSTLFDQKTVAAVLDCSTQLLERNRWAGLGIPYVKIGRSVRYRKQDVLDFLHQQKTYYSTSDRGQSINAA